MRDLNNFTEIHHSFSIVVIRDTFTEQSNRYLLYYDERWKLNMFLNYRTQKTEKENVANIISRLSDDLQVSVQDVVVEFKGQKLMKKYSVSDAVYKVYAHKLYFAVITKFPLNLQTDSFMIGNKKYSWWSMDDMKFDAGIKEHNLDVVDWIERSII